jgi:hypothetical protein
LPETVGTFAYTAAARASLEKKSQFVAAILQNLTTTCREPKAPVVLSGVKAAPFEGSTGTRQGEKVLSSVAYSGMLTVAVRRAIIDVEVQATKERGKHRIHAEVTEDGEATVVETEE